MHLLVEVIFPLIFVDLFLGFFLYFLLHREVVFLFVEDGNEADGTVLKIVDAKQTLTLLEAHGEVGGDVVDHHRRIGEGFDAHERVLRDILHVLEELECGSFDAGCQSRKLGRIHTLQVFGSEVDTCFKIRVCLCNLIQIDTLYAL